MEVARVLLVVVAVAAAASGVRAADDQGEVFLGQARENCRVSKLVFPCVKYRIMKYIDQYATTAPNSVVPLWGPVKLVTLAHPSNMTDPMFGDTQPRTTDTDFEEMFKFAAHTLERVLTTHAVQLGYFDAEQAAAGRGKYHRKQSLLLPLILLFKIKAMLVPILLGVMFIKKLLVIAAFLVPGVIGYFKSQHEKVHYEPPHVEYPHHDYHDYHASADVAAEYPGGYDSYGPHKEYAVRSSRRRAQQLAYHNYYSQLNQVKAA